MSEKVSKVFAEKRENNYLCEHCHYKCFKKSDFMKHLGSAKHKSRINSEKVSKVFAESLEHYTCEYCHYVCYIKSNFIKHLSTTKHKKNEQNQDKKTPIPTIVDPSLNDVKLLTGLVVELVKNNNDFQKQMFDVCQKQMLEICQKIQPNNNNSHNTTNTNSHNKTFNLHFFLNEECKDAMNLSEFINSIQPKLSDLENIGKVGYVEGVSNIIIKELNETQLTKRPVHCSDAKRETLYIKEEDKWEKDTGETKRMVKAVKDVSKKTSNLLITEWKDKHPEFMDSSSKDCKDFKNLAGKIYDGDEANVNKVVKKVAKEVVIDKLNE